MSIPSSLGSQIRAIRKKKGITQQELAEKLGVTQRVISYYENEDANLSVEVIQKIARVLGVPRKKLFEFEDCPEEESAISPALQRKINLIAKLPYIDQQYILKTIEVLALKNGVAQ